MNDANQHKLERQAHPGEGDARRCQQLTRRLARLPGSGITLKHKVRLGGDESNTDKQLSTGGWPHAEFWVEGATLDGWPCWRIWIQHAILQEIPCMHHADEQFLRPGSQMR